MGYSIAAPIKSQKLKDKMMKFLDENFRTFEKVIGKESRYGNYPTDDLSYDDGKLRIGFNYSGMGDIERNYIFGVCKWISLKVGRKKKIGERTVPYYVYDGDEAIAIPEALGPVEKMSLLDCLFEGELKHPVRSPFEVLILLCKINPGYQGQMKNVKAEIQRLEDLWNECS